MAETRLNVRIEGAMFDHVENVINQGLYANQSEYVRDLIRRNMEQHQRPGPEVERQLNALWDHLEDSINSGPGRYLTAEESLAGAREYAARQDAQNDEK